MLKFSDARNFGRTFTGLALIAGPLVFLIAQIVSPDVDNDNKLTELNDIAAHKGPTCSAESCSSSAERSCSVRASA